LKIFHFEQSLNGLIVIKPVAFAVLPYTAQNQLEHESYRKSFQKQLAERQGLEDEMLQSQQNSFEKQQIEVQKLKDERQGLEERWRNEYLQERQEWASE
jgi:predicted transcriptional regulator